LDAIRRWISRKNNAFEERRHLSSGVEESHRAAATDSQRSYLTHSPNVRFRPIADVKLCRDIALMADDFPRRLKIAVGASLATSGVLGLWTFVFTDVTAGPIIFINWCFFGMATYLLIFPLLRLGTVSPSVIPRLKAWLSVFLSFTLAGWVALLRTGHPL